VQPDANPGRPAVDPASPDWLGRWSDRAEIRDSGLWNVDHVARGYEPKFLEVLERYVRTGSGPNGSKMKKVKASGTTPPNPPSN